MNQILTDLGIPFDSVKGGSALAKNLQRARALSKNPSILPTYLNYRLQEVFGKDPELVMFGHRFRAFPDFNSFLGASHYRPDPMVISFVSRYAKSAKTIIDAGSNFGVFTAILADAAPTADIHAFEAHPHTYASLLKNLPENARDRIFARQIALGRTEGEVAFTDGTPASNRITVVREGTISVRQTSIDAYCKANGIEEIDFIKIDVEGAELELLEGASRLFSDKRVASGMIEICPANLETFGCTVDQMIDWFRAHGYRLCEFTSFGGQGALFQVDSLTHQSFSTDASLEISLKLRREDDRIPRKS